MFEEWQKGLTIGEICKRKGITLQEYFYIDKLDQIYGNYPSDWFYTINCDPNKNIKVTKSKRIEEMKTENEIIENVPYSEEEYIRIRNQYKTSFSYVSLPKDKSEKYSFMANLISNCLNKCALEKSACSNIENHKIENEWQYRLTRGGRCECGAFLKDD